MKKPPILVIDDEESVTSTVSSFLEAKGYRVTAIQDGAEALEAARSGRYPIILSDIYIDRVSGLEILAEARARRPDCAVILMTARGSVETTVKAETGGAFEYLVKPFELRDLLAVVERAATALASTPAEPEAVSGPPFSGIVGTSAAMVEVYKKIARCARSDETVLITGETGSGKELVARAIHRHSARGIKPFVAVDAVAITGSLWESEVFGAVRGAFTGADRDRPGVVEVARGGTVFFDEISEVPLDLQAKLLRFLQEKEYRPVGAGAPKKADVRVLAATNRRLEEMVRQGRFREDLYYRLNVLPIEVPPLRERRSDIPLLVRHFLQQATAAAQKRVWLEPEAARLLEPPDWPGNVRELENVIRRLVALNPPGPIPPRDVEAALRAGLVPESDEDEPRQLDEMERRQILKVLEETGGNKTRAAEILGIQRRTLYKKLARIEREAAGHTAGTKTPQPPETA
jgi:DNA-binding NtrC family response regulator